MSTAALASTEAPLASAAPSPMVDVGDVATLFDVNRQTVHDWIRRGLLPPPVRIARTIRWPRAVIEKMLMGSFGA